MQPKHLDEIERLEQECFPDPWSRDCFLRELKNPLAHFYVAMENSRVVGYAGGLFILDTMEIESVAVNPAERGRGIAKGLLTRLFMEASQCQISVVNLEVRESNAAAIGLYESAGFLKVGIRKNYYRNPVENALLYTKFLEE